jgi:pyruvate/2-oxoacid:ferredoxin oxidoreductase alpha subunit
MGHALVKGNEAVVHGAILAGCRSFYGYPITPASEITEDAARLFPLTGGTFVQAESETAAINMVYGAAATGERTMTASSGPGLSLMQEGLSYLAGAELPCVVVDVTRGGPGLGNIAPEQGDYNQMVKGGGHGSYHTIVYAPATAQEMCDLTIRAFEAADRFRNPAIVLADGAIGQMMEPVWFPRAVSAPPEKPWAVRGDAATRRNLVSSIYLDPVDLERHELGLAAKYERARRELVEHRTYRADDARVLLVGYGIVARVLRSAVDQARERGLRFGLFRPVTLWPFPSDACRDAAERAERVVVVELSNGQMVDDVRLALGDRREVAFHGRLGGIVPSADEILAAAGVAREATHAG